MEYAAARALYQMVHSEPLIRITCSLYGKKCTVGLTYPNCLDLADVVSLSAGVMKQHASACAESIVVANIRSSVLQKKVSYPEFLYVQIRLWFVQGIHKRMVRYQK